ncbi:MAG: IPT/TIG domain-containing protein [Bryobacteraceae bacterium]|jgi:uncharacterized protein (TIGR03437 family)
MFLKPIKSLLRTAGLTLFSIAVAAAQTQDTSGNGLLKGTYNFRHVAVQNVDENSNPTEITAIFGTITFDGAGNYTLNAMTVDNTVLGGAPQPLTLTSTYAIGSSGSGYITNELYPTDIDALIYGAVAQGVFTGSSTESEQDYTIFNDIFIALPAGSSPPTNASFTSSYQTGLLDFTGAGSTAVKNALFELSPNGKGAFGPITLNGQAANQLASSLTQNVTGATYSFSNGIATLTIPLPSGVSSTNALFTGSKTLVASADGNFILGWTAGGYDIFFGVKALTATATNSISEGLYFTAALEDAPDISGTDSYYGGTNNTGDSNGDSIVHERFNTTTAYSTDYGSDDQIQLSANGGAGPDVFGYDYLFGDGGQAFVAIGTDGLFSLQVGLHAPAFSGPGVYLSPIGVANAASLQPVTASIAPGELILLIGTGLASTTMVTQGGQTFPTSLGGVSVTIDGFACPIYYVAPTQLAVAVPYEVASNQTGLANIQVTNNKVQSNVVQVYVTDAAPGAFSQNADGIGFAAANHAATGQLITQANPALPGEYISLYLTGLGTVTPTVADGALGPSSPLSWADVYNADNLSVYFNDYGPNGTSTENPGTITYAGLAPTLAGLYQINVQVPTSGLAAGDDIYIEFMTDAADVNEIQVPYGVTAPAGRSVAAAGRVRAVRSRAKNRMTRRAAPAAQ